MPGNKSLSVIFSLCGFLTIGAVSAQFESDSGGDNIAFDVSSSKKEVSSDGSFKLSVTARIADGWHIYGFKEYEGSVATVISLDADQPFRLGDIDAPAPRNIKKEIGDVVLEYDSYEGDVTFKLPVSVMDTAKSGDTEVKGTIQYQLCSDKVCLLPKTFKFAVPIRLNPPGTETESPFAAFLAQTDKSSPPTDSDASSDKTGPTRASKMSYKISPRQKLVSAGGTFELDVEVKLDDGWHIYGIERSGVGIKTAVELSSLPFSRTGPLTGSVGPKTAAATEFGPEYDYYEGDVVFTAKVQVAADAPLGMHKASGVFHFQECNENSCLRPSSKSFDFKIEITAGTGTTNAATPTPASDGGEADIEKSEVTIQGLLGFLGLAVVAGMLTLITPCVFPLIPVTISYFLKQSSDHSASTFSLSLCYGGGIIGSFTGLGFILTVFFSANAARQFAANPIVNGVIGVLFVVFAFSLLGAFELRLPASFQQKFNFMGKGGYAGALFLGLTFAVTAFACTAPFASAVLLAASQGEYFWSILGMLAYSGTMAVPFFILGLFPSLMQNLPKSGGWMNAVKVCFGFFELAAAFKFFSNVDWQMGWGVLPRSIVLSIWVICSAFVCLYLLQLFRLPHDMPQESISVTRVTFALITGALALWMATGLGGKSLGYIEAFLPPEQVTTAKDDSEEKQWMPDIPFAEGRALAARDGKPLVVEFTGFT